MYYVRSRSQLSNSKVHSRSACRMQGVYRSARFEFLAAALLKIHAFWNSTPLPHGLVNIYRRFERSLRAHLRVKESLFLELLNHENKSAKFGGNVDKYLPIDMA